MRLIPIQFLMICPDGLVRQDGHSFEVEGRKLVVHKERPQLLVIDPNYKVSALVGFGIPIPKTESRVKAVAFANDEVSKIGATEWYERCQMAEEAKRNKKVVEG